MTVNLITFLFALLFTALAPAVPLFTTTAINPDPAIITSSTNFPSGDLNIGMACTEHELKCLAAKDNGKGGGVFECLNGAWKLRVQCSDSESGSKMCRRKETRWSRGGVERECERNAPKKHGDMLGAKDFAKQGQKGGIGMAGWDFG
ncbi:hypothetical protein IQ06DRAFT_340789 [Phaeosphaeriaceae sp. SRC1lsM3a]|nr:hypothetical protein IQ06DRAFT_340789 [Stagonospora sp. SRC1lsM3a]